VQRRDGAGELDDDQHHDGDDVRVRAPLSKSAANSGLNHTGTAIAAAMMRQTAAHQHSAMPQPAGRMRDSREV